MKRLRFFLPVLLLLVIVILPEAADAQCAMCKVTAENGIKDGQTTSAGLNKAILYLLSMPYVLAGTIGLLWYRNHRRNKKLAQELEY